jgi:hypothetical protein
MSDELADDEVIVTRSRGRNARVYHTDPGCPSVAEMVTSRTRERTSLADDYRVCSWCSGTASHEGNGNGWDLHDAAKETNPDDLELGDD